MIENIWPGVPIGPLHTTMGPQVGVAMRFTEILESGFPPMSKDQRQTGS